VDGMPSENETNAEPESNKAPEPKKEKKASAKEEHDAEHSIKVIEDSWKKHKVWISLEKSKSNLIVSMPQNLDFK
jgi:hypothetical protein